MAPDTTVVPVITSRLVEYRFDTDEAYVCNLCDWPIGRGRGGAYQDFDTTVELHDGCADQVGMHDCVARLNF